MRVASPVALNPAITSGREVAVAPSEPALGEHLTRLLARTTGR